MNFDLFQQPNQDSPNYCQQARDRVQDWEPIALSEMDSVRLLDRVDTKFLLSAKQLLAMLDEVAGSYQVLEVGGKRVANYNTLYYDTPKRDCYRDHHNGRLSRWKYRARSYGPDGPFFLEAKHKTNKRRTVKTRFEVETADVSFVGENADALLASHHRDLGVEPSVGTAFSRMTLVDVVGQERVTIDFGLEFWSPSGQQAKAPQVAIVELKQPRRSSRSGVGRQLRSMRIAPMGFSKYCIGSVLLNPGIKHNCFLATLRQLRSLATQS